MASKIAIQLVNAYNIMKWEYQNRDREQANQEMMGRQVNFYLSNGDQIALLKLLSEQLDIAAILPPFNSLPPQLALPVEYAEWKSGEHGPYFFLKEDYDSISYRQNTVLGERKFFVDSDRSPVVEFLRCVTRGAKIQSGRFFYIPRYFDAAGRKIEKSDDFIRSAQKMFSLTKKFCASKHNFDYVGPEATALQKQGWTLGLLP